MKLLILLLLSVSTIVFAGESKTRPASEADFIGYWRIFNVPDEIHKGSVKNTDTGFGNPCEFVLILASHEWKTLTLENPAGADETKFKCPNRKEGVDIGLLPFPYEGPSQRPWKRFANVEGLFTVSEPKVTYLWKADIVNQYIRSPELFGFDLQKGDMVITFLKLLGNNRGVPQVSPQWYMVLRPVL